MEIGKYNSQLYQKSSQIILGFHGCDKSAAIEILNSNSKNLFPSKNDYDWLGSGIYFWLNDPQRAYEWAMDKHRRSPQSLKEPFVIGAVIDLGLCLNLCERTSIQLLQKSYNQLQKAWDVLGYNFNEEYKNTVPDAGGFNLIRKLDCAVIEHMHQSMKHMGINYDSVYGYFQEGRDAFPGAGIKEKSHIQICVRNVDCIKGYFLPRVASFQISTS